MSYFKSYKKIVYIFLFLFISSFISVLQVLMGYSNLSILGIISSIFFNDTAIFIIMLNLIFSLISSYYFYIAKTDEKEIFPSIGIIFFLNALGMIIFEEYFINTYAYNWQFQIEAILISLIFLIITFIKKINAKPL